MSEWMVVRERGCCRPSRGWNRRIKRIVRKRCWEGYVRDRSSERACVKETYKPSKRSPVPPPIILLTQYSPALRCPVMSRHLLTRRLITPTGIIQKEGELRLTVTRIWSCSALTVLDLTNYYPCSTAVHSVSGGIFRQKLV